MDELCFHFSQVMDKKTSCVLRHPGMESSNFTVILAATADGNLLPPFVVFKVRSELIGERAEKENGTFQQS